MNDTAIIIFMLCFIFYFILFFSDEPQPFRIYTKGKLYHADADEIFSKEDLSLFLTFTLLVPCDYTSICIMINIHPTTLVFLLSFTEKVEAGEITVYKDEIKTPQYGDMYVLDKNFGKYMFVSRII